MREDASNCSLKAELAHVRVGELQDTRRGLVHGDEVVQRGHGRQVLVPSWSPAKRSFDVPVIYNDKPYEELVRQPSLASWRAAATSMEFARWQRGLLPPWTRSRRSVVARGHRRGGDGVVRRGRHDRD